MNPAWIVRTARLVLTPVQWRDLPALQAIKADARVFAPMLGGVRTPEKTAQELADEIALWGARGVGIWVVRENDRFEGLTGLMQRADGRGMALRFAFWPEARGRGLAREAAGSALRFAHDRAGVGRIVAVAREDNYGSRMVLGGIGMIACETFVRDGYTMIVFESVRRPG